MSDESIKVMSLLDELEEMITNSNKMPFSEKGIIDLDMAQSIIEDIRLSLPKDLQQARWIEQEKDRILNDAKNEYNKVIMSAKSQAEYLVDTDLIKREAQKRADAVLKQADSEASYMKMRTYEYIDKLLYDMQNDIASVANQYLQPMNEYLSDMLGGINVKVNQNRQEMKNLAEKVQLNENTDKPEAEEQ